MKKDFHQYFILSLLGLLIFISSKTNAQTSNLHCKWVNTTSNIFLDTLAIEERTIDIKHSNGIGAKLNFDFDMITSKLTFKSKDLPDSLFVCYRTFPPELTKKYYTRTLAEYDSNALFTNNLRAIKLVSLYQQEELFPTENIYKSGSLTRGISFGNSQSLGVTSSLNFQMEGKLTDDLNIRAVITDQNIPFQPEGNTQQLRDFDNVFIEVYNESLSLRAGDLVLQSPESNFLKYYKNVQGGQFNVNYKIGEKGNGRSSVSASAAKGQFADLTVDVIEGVQGPYKLTGANGEQFVIVLANSEKIYLDGRLLKRGFSYDYVIDYNLGEITFNPSVLITRFSRVRVNYEFSDRNYSRSILATSHELNFGKASLSFNYYREKDNENQPLAFDLSNIEKQALSDAGEMNIPAQVDGDRPAFFNENLLLYEKRDTIDNDGNNAVAFVFSRDSSASLFQVTYSQVVPGKGDYSLLSNTVNGRVFEWVSPQMGVNQGDYAPVTFIAAPNQKQMATIGAAVQLTEYSKVFSEIAFSNHDLNLFSPLDAEDDKDMAVKAGYRIENQPLGFLPDYKFSGGLDFEHDGKNFKAIDRFRYIEFDRDWSYQPDVDTVNETDNIFNIYLNLNQNQFNEFTYKLATRKRGEVIDGTQQTIDFKKSFGGLKLKSGAYLMENQRATNKSTWKKYHTETYFDKHFLVPGVRLEADRNEISSLAKDSIISTAFNYDAQSFYLRSHDTLKTKYRLEHIVRTDKQAFEGNLVDFSESKTTNFNLSSDIGEHHNLDVVFTYRTLSFTKDFANNENEETILGRLNWSGSFLDNHIRNDLTYATSSSRELRREFVYIPVVTGEGTHTWRDLNEDGIQDITEFFEAINFDERNFIKLFVPTNTFIAAFSNLFNMNLNLTMPRSWKTESGMRNFLSKFSNNTTININKKNTDDSFNSRFNPFELDTENDNLIFVKDGFRNTLFFNRSNPQFGFNLGYFSSHSKQLISSGIESRNNKEYKLNSRINIQKSYTFAFDVTTSKKENLSDFLDNRNYNIASKAFKPQFIWQPKNTLRFTSAFEYKRKENLFNETQDEFSELKTIKLNVRWNKAVQNSIDASFRYINIGFEGTENTPAGYELLEALKPGNNYTWRLDYRQKLSNGLQMNFSYEGRKSNDQRVIQIGRMQVTALF